MVKLISNLLNNDLAPDFTDPLGLLSACHQRILGFCDLLEKVASHINANGVDEEAEQAAKKIHRYFSTSAKLHHLDEEQDLFPLVVDHSQKITAMIREIEQEHVILDKSWNDLEPLLEKPTLIGKGHHFSQQVELFCSAYRQHITKENEKILHVIKSLLSAEQLQELGSKMQQRRQPSVSA